MALNFTVSYTFSPSTTISSSQVNTNTSDVASVFQGLEAETKTLAKLKVDIDPTAALNVATKQYVDHYANYRRPVLVYNSATVVNIEAGINGTSGQAQILFPDGNLRQDSTSGRINCNLAQVAALSGSWQSGLRTGSVAANTWYAVYAVKTTDDASKFVAVADTVLPILANFTTLNSNFGTNGWVYLGLVRYGDNGGATTAIISFVQVGNHTVFTNVNSGPWSNATGTLLVQTASAAAITWAYAAGTGTAQVPANISIVDVEAYANGAAGGNLLNFSGLTSYDAVSSTAAINARERAYAINVLGGFQSNTANGGSTNIFISLTGFWDSVLGIGSNPLL